MQALNIILVKKIFKEVVNFIFFKVLVNLNFFKEVVNMSF